MTRPINTPGAPGQNTGHGHVFARPDGARARCGGPALCSTCAVDQARKLSEQAVAAGDVVELHAQRNALLAIHHRDRAAADDDRRPTCIEDCDPWPCPTARALGVTE